MPLRTYGRLKLRKDSRALLTNRAPAMSASPERSLAISSSTVSTPMISKSRPVRNCSSCSTAALIPPNCSSVRNRVKGANRFRTATLTTGWSAIHCCSRAEYAGCAKSSEMLLPSPQR
ncbi:Uncharacterised protein [Bordetella pertussis]|nr:Uncharacterised protein [Bordetella pertussis]CPL00929.1 Uncharacterised protein [Bordetella pertussis]CPM79662.1 Uncharacterised protein [Bordetella pertussis]